MESGSLSLANCPIRLWRTTGSPVRPAKPLPRSAISNLECNPIEKATVVAMAAHDSHGEIRDTVTQNRRSSSHPKNNDLTWFSSA